nr:unnamed protein product [Callosobruchus chinensis]
MVLVCQYTKHPNTNGHVNKLIYSFGEAHVVALDISKAFDQLWLADFLSSRKIIVVVDCFSSSFHNINCCSHIWGTAAPTTLPIPDAPLSHQRAVGDLSLFYRYSNGFCSSELTSIITPLSKPGRCTRGTSCSHPRAVVLHVSRTE